MRKFEYTIKNDEGIHAIPASILTKTAKAYKSDVVLYRGQEMADMKDLFDVMGMGIKKNTPIRIEIVGEDEEQAMDAMVEILKQL